MATMPDIKVNVLPPKLNLKAWVTYRRAELEFESRELSAAPPISVMGGMVARGERLRVIEVLLNELDRFAVWMDQGEPSFIPPLSENDKAHWRWVRDKGLDVPPHIEAQL
jgi:hypothetical protein